MSDAVVYNSSRYGAKAAYTTYEADQGTFSVGATVKKASSPHSTAYEASKQSYVDLPANAAVSFTAKADADAATLRYTVPDGATGKVEIQVNGKPVANLDLSSKHNWQYLENYEHHKDEVIAFGAAGSQRPSDHHQVEHHECARGYGEHRKQRAGSEQKPSGEYQLNPRQYSGGELQRRNRV